MIEWRYRSSRRTLRVDARELALEPGTMVSIPSKASASMRQEPGYESLVLEWEAGAIGSSPRQVDLARVPQTTVDSARAIAQILSGAGGSQDVLPTVARAVCLFAALGAPVDSVTEAHLAERVDPRTAQLSRTLDRLLSSLEMLPMIVDLDREIGLSARQVSRLVAGFNRRYGFNSGSWSDTRMRRRIAVATRLMTTRRATTERVARLVGYSGPAAFCRALADHGLPAPGNVAREVRNLA